MLHRYFLPYTSPQYEKLPRADLTSKQVVFKHSRFQTVKPKLDLSITENKQSSHVVCITFQLLNISSLRRYSIHKRLEAQRRSPMYCKIFIEVTKTSPHKSTNENALQVVNRTHNQYNSPMFCKFEADVTKTIADVLQDLYRSHKDITTQVNQ